MAGLIRVSKEILRPNSFGEFWVGPKRGIRSVQVTGIGDYPALRGETPSPITFVDVPNRNFIQAILPPYHSMFITAVDLMDHEHTATNRLLGKDGSDMFIDEYTMESIGGKQEYLLGRVCLLSWEVATHAQESRPKSL